MATAPFNFACDLASGFVADPKSPRRFGYVVALDGSGLPTPLAADLTVHPPFDASVVLAYKALAYSAPSAKVPLGVAKVVGVIENLSWAGGVGDPIRIDFYVSQEIALQIKALQQTALKTSLVRSLAWWIADYDQEAKTWFEQAYPLGATGTVSGLIAGKENLLLDVNLKPVPVKDGIDVYAYKVSIVVAPSTNVSYTLYFANSAQKKTVKSWGLVVGTLAPGAKGPTA